MVAAGGLGELAEWDTDRVRDGVQHPDCAVHPTLFDLDQHPAGHAAAFGETVES
jgi:hypothetical protein